MTKAEKKMVALRAVYAELVKGYPVTLKSVAQATGLNKRTVASARNYLVMNKYVEVEAFFGRDRVMYKSTQENRAMVFGRVSSIENDLFDHLVVIDGYNFDWTGEKIPCRWELRLDNSVMKAIADYVKANDEVPFF